MNSLKFIFGKSETDPKSQKIMSALKENPTGLTQSQIYRDIFKNNVPSNKIKQALEHLSSKNKIASIDKKTNGRNQTIWKAV